MTTAVSTFSSQILLARLRPASAGRVRPATARRASLSLAGWPAAGAAKAAQLWLIEIAGCEIHLVGSDAELRNLLRRRPVTGETQVYEVGARPRALQNVPELARLLPQAADSEPPIRQPRPRLETRSPERAKLSEELAVLNRPLEDEVEYYDEVRRSRAKPVFAAVMFVAALAGAGYLLLAQRDRAATRRLHVLCGKVSRRRRSACAYLLSRQRCRRSCKNARDRAGGRANAGRTDRSKCSGESRQHHVRQRPRARTRRRSAGAIRDRGTQPGAPSGTTPSLP